MNLDSYQTNLTEAWDTCEDQGRHTAENREACDAFLDAFADDDVEAQEARIRYIMSLHWTITDNNHQLIEEYDHSLDSCSSRVDAIYGDALKYLDEADAL